MFSKALENALYPFEPMSWTDAFLLSCAALAVSLPLLAAAYLAKSALGINLMAGPSPLHELLYQFVS